eukprot:TRINITY_DN5834_c1_g2_i2.p2 TRINITY_DN5834_c1_g2~~TRINITY_DN5834_c1_g2_i2.p2  ORF type:complete len:394 (-),score=93.41 TRINITY_DN5834_c1_g2_i2:107-1288(-)
MFFFVFVVVVVVVVVVVIVVAVPYTRAMAQQRGNYVFSTEPRAVAAQRKKYRDPVEATPPANIMFDRRVVRGSNYAKTTQTTEPSRLAPTKPRAVPQQQKARPTKRTADVGRLDTPEAVDGRRHMDMQTDQYLEEILERPIEVEMEVQTDAALDRPPTPLFVARKAGEDKATCIQEGDLFDFDHEVEPLLEQLVGKVLEQAVQELVQEEELAALRRAREEYRRIRQAEQRDVERMERDEQEKQKEKQRRIAHEKVRVEREKELHEKQAAASLARTVAASVTTSVMSGLARAGFFNDPVQKEVETDFCPWLLGTVNIQLSHITAARRLVDDILSKTLRVQLVWVVLHCTSSKQSVVLLLPCALKVSLRLTPKRYLRTGTFSSTMHLSSLSYSQP